MANRPFMVDTGVSGPAGELLRAYREVASWRESKDRPTIERALYRIADATARQPSWAWPHLLAARVLLMLHLDDAPLMPSEGVRIGELYQDAAWRHLKAALALEPDLTAARRLLASLSYASADRILRDITHELLRDEVSRSAPDPDALIAWARHQRTQLQYRDALRTFGRALTAGADRSVVQLEQARTLAGLGQFEAASNAYWAGLEQLTSKGRALYQQDFAWILLGDSLAPFTAVADADLAAWIQRFWAARDAAAASPAGARLLEHLRRWAHVHEHYRVPAPWNRTQYHRVDLGFDAPPTCVGSVPAFFERLPVKPPSLPGDPRSSEPLLDHRALLYLKHGPPFTVAIPARTTEEAAAREAEGITPDAYGEQQRELSAARYALWIYWIEGSWRVFALRGSNVFGSYAPTTLASAVRGTSATWEAIAHLDPKYAEVAAQLAAEEKRFAVFGTNFQPVSCGLEFTASIRQMREDADIALDTDSDTPTLARAWNAPLQFFAVGRGDDRTGRVLVTFALPVSDLQVDTQTSGAVQWPVQFRIVAYRASDGRRVDLDTTRRFVAAAVPHGSKISGHFEIPLDDGTWQVAVIARQALDTTAGAYALRRNLVVGGSNTLTLSDVVTGREGQPAWRAPDGPFPVNTLGTWVEGSIMELWYEVRGLDAGDTYRTTIEVIPSTRRLGEPIRVATTDNAPGSIIQVRKAVGLERLRAGAYRLVVTVEQGDNRAIREQDILIVERP